MSPALSSQQASGATREDSRDAAAPTARRPHLDALTSMRFWAALHVVIYHFAQRSMAWMPTPLRNVVAAGHVWVSFFFVLSGFILAWNYCLPDGRLRGSRRAFWGARISRVYPMYVFAILLNAPFVLSHRFTSEATSTALAKSSVALGWNLLALQAWLPRLGASWNFPSWSVSVEVFFYLAFPLLAPGLARRSIRTQLALMLMLVVGTSTVEFALIAGHDGRSSFPLVHLHEFVAGIVCARVVASRGSSDRPWWLPDVALLALLAVLIVPPGSTAGLVVKYGLPLLFCATIAWVAEGDRRSPLVRFLNHRASVRLGEISYAIYILQDPVWRYWAVGMHRIGIEPFSGGSVILYAFVLLGGSLIGWRFVEEPARRGLRAWLVRENRGRVPRDESSPRAQRT